MKIMKRRGIVPAKVDTHKGEEVGWTYEIPRQAIRVKLNGRAINIGGRKSQSMVVS
jgi:hypothetical protein